MTEKRTSVSGRRRRYTPVCLVSGAKREAAGNTSQRGREREKENVIKRDRVLFGIFTSPVKNYFRVSRNRRTNASVQVVAVAPASRTLENPVDGDDVLAGGRTAARVRGSVAEAEVEQRREVSDKRDGPIFHLRMCRAKRNYLSHGGRAA